MDDYLDYILSLIVPPEKIIPKASKLKPRYTEPVAATTYVAIPNKSYELLDYTEPENDISEYFPEPEPREVVYSWDDPTFRQALLDSQIYQESRWNPNAKSPAGAMGLAQFMPITWKDAKMRGWIPENASPYNEKYALIAQKKLMEYLFNRPLIINVNDPKEKLRRVLAAYNAGYGNVAKAIRKAGGSRDWLSFMRKETQNYVPSIINRAIEYTKNNPWR